VKLLDTIVLVGAMNPEDKYHKAAMGHLRAVQSAGKVYVPTSSLIEFDLVMRSREYAEVEIRETWTAIAPLIDRKVVVTSPSAHLIAAEMRSQGLTYFDSLIAALAKEMEAVVITRDPEISRHVDTEW
jgi:predicted nucleic-acid-binding protein